MPSSSGGAGRGSAVAKKVTAIRRKTLDMILAASRDTDRPGDPKEFAAILRAEEGVITAQEEERKRTARELHDSVNQILAAVKFRVEAVAEIRLAVELLRAEQRKRADRANRGRDLADFTRAPIQARPRRTRRGLP